MINIKNPVKKFGEIVRGSRSRSTPRVRHLTAMLSIAITLGMLAVMLALFRAAIVGYLGSTLAWWIVVGVICGLILLQTILLVKQKGGTQMSLLGWLFGVIGMLGLAVLAAIFFSLAWPGVLLALLAGAWGRTVERAEERTVEEKPAPAEPSYQVPVQADLKVKVEQQ